MKNLFIILSILVLAIGCNKEDETISTPIIQEQWKQIFSETSDKILDSKVNGEELHLISAKHFYRLKGEEIIEKRELISPNRLDDYEPLIGNNLIFRLLNFDSVMYLEFQPIKEGGSPYRVDIQNLGTDDLTFPVTSAGSVKAGRFEGQNNFIFMGRDYPSGQQFIVELKIDYNETTNTIENIDIQERVDIVPISSGFGSSKRILNIFAAGDISFISRQYGGVYKYENNEIQQLDDLNLSSFFMDGQDTYSTYRNFNPISKSSDGGLTWTESDFLLTGGNMLYKKGEYFIETNNTRRIYRIGKSIETLEPFDSSQFDEDYINSKVEFYNGKYLLIRYFYGENQIFQKSDLD